MKPDYSKSVDFLQKFAPDGPWALTAIRTDKKSIQGSVFQPNEAKKVISWLDSFTSGDWNFYFHVNKVQGDIQRKAEKGQILSSEWLYVDVDSREGFDLSDELERILGLVTTKLPKGIPEPTVIIFSGGGYQAFWKLKDPFPINGNEENWERYESFNKRLEQVFDGDHCFNVDRIMRLPGTINHPDAKKVKKGRTPQLARVIEFNNKTYDLELKFKGASPVQTGGHIVRDAATRGEVDIDMEGHDNKIMDLAELDEWDVPERVKVVIAQGRHPDQPKKGDNSRSAWVFDCVCNLLRFNVPDGVIYSILTDPDWGIAESVLEQKDPNRYAIKQIVSAKELVVDPDLHFMNSRHAVIGNIGGKCRVIEEVPDDVMNRTRVTFSSFEDIRNRYGNKMVKVGVDKDDNPVYVQLGKYWLNHSRRQQFDFMKFMPNGAPRNVFNLWRGFAVTPRPGDCDLFLDHIRENICNGVDEHYQYLLNWMARAVQYPASQGEVAVVIRGGKGTGKSLFATMFGEVFGRHSLHISNPSHLVGNFNAHLKDTILLFADEAFFAGDRKHESVLKMLVTENSIPIEQKHVDVEPYPNYVHLIMAANDPHVVRATGDERRFFVLEASQRHQQDTEYFEAIVKQMKEDGGLEALLLMLQNRDISEFQVRKVPQTGALQEQKMLSMNYDEEWWFRKLRDGRMLETDSKWDGTIECSVLVSDFTNYAETWKISRRGNETALGRFLNRVAPHVERKQVVRKKDVQDEDGRPSRRNVRTYVYIFGGLDRCRAAWEKVNGKVEWDQDHQPEFNEEIEDPF